MFNIFLNPWDANICFIINFMYITWKWLLLVTNLQWYVSLCELFESLGPFDKSVFYICCIGWKEYYNYPACRQVTHTGHLVLLPKITMMWLISWSNSGHEEVYSYLLGYVYIYIYIYMCGIISQKIEMSGHMDDFSWNTHMYHKNSNLHYIYNLTQCKYDLKFDRRKAFMGSHKIHHG
jgi:hypothetical protein